MRSTSFTFDVFLAILVGAMFAAILGTCATSCEPVVAQDNVQRDQVALAGLCIHEMTWNVESDCEPMYQVVRARQTRMGYRTLSEAIATNSRRYWHGTSTRPWARRLRPGVYANPVGWPSSWPDLRTYRERLDAAFDFAGRIVQGEVEPQCEEQPHRWGSLNPMLPDLARAERMIREGRWVRVDCPGARQGYYAVAAWRGRDAS